MANLEPGVVLSPSTIAAMERLNTPASKPAMTENTPNFTGELTMPANPVLGVAQISAARIEKSVPDAYRLVGHRTDDGFAQLRLQGYFTWQQGWISTGGEWRDIDTVDIDDLSDDKPYGHLWSTH